MKKTHRWTIRNWFYCVSTLTITATLVAGYFWPLYLHTFWVTLPLIALGIHDTVQTRKNILRIYPLWGHWRYLLLKLRPYVQQYFIKDDIHERPFSKEMRDLVYARAANTQDTVAFGTVRNTHEPGHEWLNHSIAPTKPDPQKTLRVRIGGAACKQPYHASRLNISAMSYGALSPEAIQALNKGAQIGGFAHNTGEGGVSAHHLKYGGDLIWQIGTGYFGCRNKSGGFDAKKFQQQASHASIKMIELKLSQGAKPGHGAMLLKEKITPEIAQARGIPTGENCFSPASHSTFDSPLSLLHFLKTLRMLSGYKPVGFKLCLGTRSEFMGICKAMIESEIFPDFITIDGAEGGTGAAPIEFSDFMGTPINEALIFVHNCLVGIGIRSSIHLIASSKIISGFDIVTKFALGADSCNSARGMLFSLGCVQSRRCHNDMCPTGITTQNKHRRHALSVPDKAKDVASFHNNTLGSFLDVLGATGLNHPDQLTPSHIYRRVSAQRALNYQQIYPYLKNNALLTREAPSNYLNHWDNADAQCFRLVASDL